MSGKKSILETGDRILRLLDCFTEEHLEWGVTELSKELELNKSVVHRMLVTLENRNFLKQDPQTKKYSLGLKLFELGMIVSTQMDLLNIAKPIIHELSSKTNETTLIHVVNDSKGLCVAIEESTLGVKSTSQLGARVPLYAGAPTKVLMAYLTKEQINNIIDKGLETFTGNTIVDPDQLKKDLKTIREKGFNVSTGEIDFGSKAITFPIRNYKSEVIASISIVGPEFRMEDKIDEYTYYCKEAAELISKKLGFG